MSKQKDSVYAAIETVLGTIETPVTFTKEQRATVVQTVAEDIFAGNVDFSDEAKAKYDTLEKVKGYASGLVNNWLRKDTRLNGGTTYTPANPGSRAGQGDEVLKNLKALRKQFAATGDAAKLTEIDAAITTRQTELDEAKMAKKVKSKEVDMSSVPDDLKEMLGIAV